MEQTYFQDDILVFNNRCRHTKKNDTVDEDKFKYSIILFIFVSLVNKHFDAGSRLSLQVTIILFCQTDAILLTKYF